MKSSTRYSFEDVCSNLVLVTSQDTTDCEELIADACLMS